MMPMRVLAALTALFLLVTGCSGGSGGQAPPSGQAAAPPGAPNIVFVLVDDMDSGLLQYLPHVRQMQQQGVSFANYTVTDSLCCPSRSSILTGKFPHNTGVFTNNAPDGGWKVFHGRDERDTIGTQLQRAGYRTGFMGKYLNGYKPGNKAGGDAPFVPPGWNEWAVAGNGYPEFNYQLNVNGKLEKHGHRPEDYLTDVLANRGDAFIRHNAAANKPFFLEVATFAPHGPFTPAPRDANLFPGLTVPQGPSFNEPDRSDKPSWLRDHSPLSPEQINRLNVDYRKRAQSLQAVDAMLARLQKALQDTGQAGRTNIVFSSDNGFHMGQHALFEGKQTAFSTDVNVPLVVTGPGVPAGRTVDQPVENIDLRPTFAELAGVPPAPGIDGQSFVPLLRGQNTWSKTTALVEHHGPNNQPDDPDRQHTESGNPPSYTAIRTAEGNYVEYANGEREYYDRRSDPDELRNTYSELPPDYQTQLHNTLVALAHCTSEQCAAAAH